VIVSGSASLEAPSDSPISQRAPLVSSTVARGVRSSTHAATIEAPDVTTDAEQTEQDEDSQASLYVKRCLKMAQYEGRASFTKEIFFPSSKPRAT